MTQNPLIPASPDYQAARDAHEHDDAALFDREDPIALFAEWLAAATLSEPNDPNAMALATCDEHGLPDVRMVLLKDFDPSGFTFYTNLESAKCRQLHDNPQAALCFHWKSLRRQVRIRGHITAVAPDEADAYFQSRARDARIGAWASDQSRPLGSRSILEDRIAAVTEQFGTGAIPRPPHWSGLRLVPVSLEFWRDRMFRLHDRHLFRRSDASAMWTRTRLYP